MNKQIDFSDTKWPTHAPIDSYMLTSWTSLIKKTIIDPCGGNPLKSNQEVGTMESHTWGLEMVQRF